MFIRILVIAAFLLLILVAVLVAKRKTKSHNNLLKWLIGIILLACLAFAAYRAIGYFMNRGTANYEVYHKIINSSDEEAGILFREYRQWHLQEMISENDSSLFGRLFLETIANDADFIVDLWFDDKCDNAAKDELISDIKFLAGKEGFKQLGWDGGTEIYAKPKGKESYERILLFIDGDTSSPLIRYAQGKFTKDAPCLIPSGKREAPPRKPSVSNKRSVSSKIPSGSSRTGIQNGTSEGASSNITNTLNDESSRVLDVLFKNAPSEYIEELYMFEYDDTSGFVMINIYSNRECEVLDGESCYSFTISSAFIPFKEEPVLDFCNEDNTKEVFFSPENMIFDYGDISRHYTVTKELYYQKNLRKFKSIGAPLGLWKNIKVNEQFDSIDDDEEDLSIWDILGMN
ncbi:MAG: hypothetical protein II542_00475 [Bacteroidales bacterium]|nr:hypothetical protein [Bacteroidales bacterium]